MPFFRLWSALFENEHKQFFDQFGANAKREEYSLQKEYGKYQRCTFLLVTGRVSINFKNIIEIKLFTKEIQDNYFFI